MLLSAAVHSQCSGTALFRSLLFRFFFKKNCPNPTGYSKGVAATVEVDYHLLRCLQWYVANP